ncbi:phenylalanine--tRNA ligase subunit alpha [Acidilobus sp.]|jgi:phenylalanyl-tRNA synthetase alpha chain|uniref:phenylalanine--tRNA ligase subunit alpha n=1 Tax=Acidilobus sp. TaxID=1872109 RepID=UPI003D089DDE
MAAEQLSPSELELLKKLASLGEPLDLEKSEELIGMPASSAASLASLLEAKGLVKVDRRTATKILLTERGEEVLRNGLPEERLLKLLEANNGSVTVDLARSSLGNDFNIAVGVAMKAGYIKIVNGVITLIDHEGFKASVINLKGGLRSIKEGGLVSEKIVDVLKGRGLVKVEQKSLISIRLLPQGLSLASAKPSIAKLSHELIATGKWREYTLRPYDVSAEPPLRMPARKHFFAEFIEELKDLMKEMGFVEVSGPLVELELFNFDALFQPQDHPAREMHDTFWPDLPPADLSDYADIVARVRYEHEHGWGYQWDEGVASRRILRSQTTAVTIRVLASRPRPPIRFFTIDKVFRADPVDATHLSDFHQLDGIMGWEDFTFRDLLGFLSEFGKRLGLELKFKPAYFPFTEPSVEGYARIGSSMVEVFGAGLFRPEVLRIAGVDYQVGAWGMGVERLALARFGLHDVRDLYSKDYDFLRSFKVKV